jgi:hypothetical protein
LRTSEKNGELIVAPDCSGGIEDVFPVPTGPDTITFDSLDEEINDWLRFDFVF